MGFNYYKKNCLKGKDTAALILFFEQVHKLCMNEVCNGRRAETITRHSDQYHPTQGCPC